MLSFSPTREKPAAGALVKYGGLNGNALLYAIVAIATCGFSLFGYDQGESLASRRVVNWE